MTILGPIDLGNLPNYLFVFTNGSVDAAWQGSTKGYIGDVGLDGLQAGERTSGTLPYAGTIYTNASTLDAWQAIINQNAGQATGLTSQADRISGLEADLARAFAQINALPATAGYTSVSAASLNGLNTQNGINETFVINITSGLQVSQKILITGDPGDVFILRWDTDPSTPGYQGQVKFYAGGAIVPQGGLTPGNFINVAGDLDAAGGGTTPPPPYPQGPRQNNGTGALITGGADFAGGGFYTGYWLTTGAPATGETASLNSAIFVGGWYTSSVKFSLSSGSSSVHVQPNPAAIRVPSVQVKKLVSPDGGSSFLEAPTPPGVTVASPTNPVYKFVVTNTGSLNPTEVRLQDTTFDSITLPTTTLAPGQSTEVTRTGSFALGQHSNTATANGSYQTQTVTSSASAYYTGVTAPSIQVQKLISIDGGTTFIEAGAAPGATLASPTNPVYKFVVTNTGGVSLTSIALTDATFGSITLPTTTLTPGQSTEVTQTGAFAMGQHDNTATVTGAYLTQTVSASATAYYTGVAAPAIQVQKLLSVDGGTTFAESGLPPGATLVEPTGPVYRFVVTNTGGVSLTGITLTDSTFGSMTLPTTTLAPGESTTVTQTGLFALGEHSNSATVHGEYLTRTATSTAAAYVTGVTPPAIQVQKLISVDGGITFIEADTPPGVILVAPTEPIYKFIITNTGGVTLTDITLTDSSISAAAVTTSQESEAGPAIQVQKLISVDGGANFVKAGSSPGVILVSPTDPVYRFVITNTGTESLTGVTLTDSEMAGVTLPTTTLAPGQFIEVTKVGHFATGFHCHPATATGTGQTGTATGTGSACFTGVEER